MLFVFVLNIIVQGDGYVGSESELLKLRENHLLT